MWRKKAVNRRAMLGDKNRENWKMERKNVKARGWEDETRKALATGGLKHDSWCLDAEDFLIFS
jgi:hypothetical protein